MFLGVTLSRADCPAHSPPPSRSRPGKKCERSTGLRRETLNQEGKTVLFLRNWECPLSALTAGAGHLALDVFLGDGFALVVGLLASRERELDLDAAVLEVEGDGDQGDAG